MKIKKFNENDNNNQLYLVIYSYDAYDLFPDYESAENYILDLVNSEKRDMNNISDDELYFTDIDEAMEWHDDVHGDIDLKYVDINLHNKYIGSDELQKRKDVDKYNL